MQQSINSTITMGHLTFFLAFFSTRGKGGEGPIIYFDGSTLNGTGLYCTTCISGKQVTCVREGRDEN